MQLVGGRAHHHLQAQLFRLFTQPDAAEILAADPAEIVAAQPEQRAVIDHAAMLVAHRGIHHLTHRQLRDVARQRVLHQRFCIGAGHLELAQGRQVDHGRLFAARPVFLDRPRAGIGIGQPVAAIFRHIPRQGRNAAVKGGILGHSWLLVGGHAAGDGTAEGLCPGIAAHMDVTQIPAVRGRGIVRTGRRDADQVGQRPEQHIIAGA